MKSRRMAVATLILLGIIAWASSSIAASSEIKWHSYEEGMALGKKLGKKVFIDFYADWCGFCRMMDRSTYQDASVIAILNRDFIPVKVHSDKEQEIALRYDIRALPNIAFISEDGTRIGSVPGYIPSERLIEILEQVTKMG
ncbi:MAG: thioredoxin family protein [Deltaproteobacteria bacterium]|nr:thioredoxin family protein [Deltaproteobacteria bacterium]